MSILCSLSRLRIHCFYRKSFVVYRFSCQPQPHRHRLRRQIEPPATTSRQERSLELEDISFRVPGFFPHSVLLPPHCFIPGPSFVKLSSLRRFAAPYFYFASLLLRREAVHFCCHGFLHDFARGRDFPFCLTIYIFLLTSNRLISNAKTVVENTLLCYSLCRNISLL